MNSLKLKVATAVLPYLENHSIIGVGTGSTVNALIPLLKTLKSQVEAFVASSKATYELLKAERLQCIDLNSAGPLSIYVDGADEIDHNLCMLKGGGGALTSEKILGAAALQWICIADETKLVKKLGKFPVVVEVLPMARSFVARQLVLLGANPIYRQNFVTDHGNIILDVYDLALDKLEAMELQIKAIAGVVEVGICAKRKANLALVASKDNILTLT